jgi:integrase
MIEVHYLTGMRSDELCRLNNGAITEKWVWVPDPKNPSKQIKRKVWHYRLTEHKTEEHHGDKTVCLGPRAQEILRKYRKQYPTGYFFRPEDTVAFKQNLRRKNLKQQRRKSKGRALNPRYTSQSYGNAIKNAFRLLALEKDYKEARGRMKMTRQDAAKAGIEWWHPHQLRHSRTTITRDSHGTEASAAQNGQSLTVNQLYGEKSRRLAEQVAAETG